MIKISLITCKYFVKNETKKTPPLHKTINNQHKLVKLSQLIDWQSFEDDWGKLFLSNQGAPATPTRMIAVHYLKHIYNLSDEQVVEPWVENPYWQSFCGEQFLSFAPPIHPTSMTKWRNRLGKKGVEKSY